MNKLNDSILAQIQHTAANLTLTNCVLSFDKILKLAEAGELSVISEKPLLITVGHEGFSQLYYFLDDVLSINELTPDILENIPEDRYPVYADITVRGEFEYSGSVFEKLGLEPFRTYIRKSVLNKDLHFPKMLDAVYAVRGDLDFIYSMLTEQFDPMSDHIPTRPELEEIIEAKQVLKINISETIGGVLLFEDFGKRSYLRALCVHPGHRHSSLGQSLLTEYLIAHSSDSTSLFYLWVDAANSIAIKLYDKYGYRSDGLKNYVFRKC